MRGLKTVLWITAIGCLAVVPLIFFPWTSIANIISWFGAASLPDASIAVYYFKVTFGVFGVIGVFFIILARDPLAYGPMLNLGAFGLILYGILAFTLGISIRLPPMVYLGDGLSGLALGIGILFLASRANRVAET